MSSKVATGAGRRQRSRGCVHGILERHLHGNEMMTSNTNNEQKSRQKGRESAPVTALGQAFSFTRLYLLRTTYLVTWVAWQPSLGHGQTPV